MSTPVTCAAALREQETAVAFAAGGVEHAQAADQRRDERVAMPVLVPDRTAHLGREALAGERERGGGVGSVGQGGCRRAERAAAATSHGVQPRIVAALRRGGRAGPPVPGAAASVQRQHDRLVIGGLQLRSTVTSRTRDFKFSLTKMKSQQYPGAVGSIFW